MSAPFTLRAATRQGVKPLIGMYGKSGSGKTMSALLLMRGIVGPAGRVALIDSESGRGSIFADIVPGGYQVLDLEPPFSPERYQDAFEMAEANADGVVIDSLTHEHAGEGGVLDMQEAELQRMAGEDYKRREACKMASWIKPKMIHKKLLGRILRCKVPLICCLRGEEKTHMIQEEGSKKKVVTDEFSTPIFDPRFIFELLLNLETVSVAGKGGYVIPRKVTHPDIAGLLPEADRQISVAHGEAIARWCASPGKSKANPIPQTEAKPAATENKVKARMFELLKPYGDLLKTFAEQRGWVAPNEGLEHWPDSRVPKDKEEMRKLMQDIETFRDTGS